MRWCVRMTIYVSLLFSGTSLGDVGDLESIPKLKDLIQQKFENILEIRSKQHPWERIVRGFPVTIT